MASQKQVDSIIVTSAAPPERLASVELSCGALYSLTILSMEHSYRQGPTPIPGARIITTMFLTQQLVS
jgi:hypothetical protein